MSEYLTTTTIVLGDKADQLAQRRDDLAAEIREAQQTAQETEDEDESTRLAREVARISQRADGANRHLKGVLWAVDQWGEDAEIVLSGLNSEEYAQVEDYLQHGRVGAGAGAHRNATVAMALEDAPFLPDGPPGFRDRLEEYVGPLPVNVTQWLESEVNDLTSPDPGNWTSFDDLLQESP